MKRLSIVVFFMLAMSLCFSQEISPAGKSVSVSIDQSMLNNFFNAIGEVKGNGGEGWRILNTLLHAPSKCI